MSIETRSLGRDVNELLVLATLEDGPKHGYQIALDVEEESDGAFELQHGTLYPVLHRLAKEGLIEGDWEEDGRRRKVYVLTDRGHRRLRGPEPRAGTRFDLDEHDLFRTRVQTHEVHLVPLAPIVAVEDPVAGVSKNGRREVFSPVPDVVGR